MRITANPHVFIRFSAHPILLHLDEFLQFHKKGCSLREISTLTGYPVSSIRKLLIGHGYPLRAGTKASKIELESKSKCHSGLPPYGFTRLDGKLVVDPREAKVVRKILEMYKQGVGFCGITDALNEKKFQAKLVKNGTVKLWPQLSREVWLPRLISDFSGLWFYCFSTIFYQN